MSTKKLFALLLLTLAVACQGSGDKAKDAAPAPKAADDAAAPTATPPSKPQVADTPSDADFGGWNDWAGAAAIIEELAELSARVAQEYGDREDEWVTVNEGARGFLVRALPLQWMVRYSRVAGRERLSVCVGETEEATAGPS
jgi:hypothetical protein